MGKIEKYEIVFDNLSGAYYAGQYVTGKVNLLLNAPLSMRGMYIRFHGQAYVHWTEQKRYYDHNSRKHEYRTVHHSDSETYFDIKQAIQGTEGKQSLDSGDFHFPFTFLLPANLPTSFEGQHGHIRYVCSSNIDRPWRFDPKCKEAFTVVSIVDLNKMPDVGMSRELSQSTYVGSCCWKTGPVSASVVINKSGFVPGESISINAEIVNSSTKQLSKTVALLGSQITYSTAFANKMETREICKLAQGPILPSSSDAWNNVQLKLPSLPPTALGGCRFITIQHFLRFYAKVPGICSRNVEFYFPITVGTVPLRNDFSMFARPSAYNDSAGAYWGPALVQPTVMHGEMGAFPMPVPSAPPMVSRAPYEPPPTSDEYPDLPPPSYEECIYGHVDIRGNDDDEHTLGKRNFAPRYAYYNQLS